eukprot:CAMPEP_0119009664 /NCGR_PEP_ID=MMETSP1176-20130426/4519_1 /TAXON_ID=265551 /ORGANISM="Synedropsis recta cf, Strain CCMP1620" /LENGTH=259 /DNA_ID=CAMNT_0006962219 /DNA_START=254 /DNA_END=1033 /DNA_ORIENTATION=-
MAPQEEKFQNDATFNALLSSQRELLNKLNFEKQLAQTEIMRNNDLGDTGGNWGYTATNQSIGFETFRTDNVLLSRRLSVGIGNDCFILPDAQFDSDQYTESFYDAADGDGKKRFSKDGEDPSNSKRRRTTLSFLDYIFDKNEESKQAPPLIMKPEKRRIVYDDSDDDDYGVIVEDVSDDDEDYNEDDENEIKPIIDLKEAKEKMVSFDAAMGKTQKSQQSIHDWDRKMGLKRSHSKTMRLSSRSRKQLREIMRKDIEEL